jgi:predicted amidohydrolase
MRVLQTLVSREGFRDSAHNKLRFRALEALFAIAKTNKCHSLQLPMGFLCATDETDRDQLLDRVVGEARGAGVAVVGGIDSDAASKRDVTKVDVLARNLPYFGFVANGSGQLFGPWRQMSTTNDNYDPQQAFPSSERTVTVAGVEVSVLLCGEIFNPNAAEAIGTMRPAVVFAPGHASIGMGLIPALQRVHASTSCPVLHSHHVVNAGSIHAIAANGQHDSRSIDKNWQYEPMSGGPFWYGWTVRDV